MFPINLSIFCVRKTSKQAFSSRLAIIMSQMKITSNGINGDVDAAVTVEAGNGQNENSTKSSWRKKISRPKKSPKFRLLADICRELDGITPGMAAGQLMRLPEEGNGRPKRITSAPYWAKDYVELLHPKTKIAIPYVIC